MKYVYDECVFIYIFFIAYFRGISAHNALTAAIEFPPNQL